MRKFASTIIVLLCFFAFTQAQEEAAPAKSPFNPYVGIITESTVSGGLAGFYAGAFLGKRFGIGAYYETPTSSFDNDFNGNRSAAGVFGSYVLLKENKLDLSVLLRAGFENEKFVIIVPSVVMGYAVSQRFHISMLGGFRYEKPSIGLTLGYRFKKL